MSTSKRMERIPVLVLGKAVVSREGSCTSHASPAGPALSPVGKVSPFPTPSTKSFWPVCLAWCLVFCRIVILWEQGQKQAKFLPVMLNLPSFYLHDLHFTERLKGGERRKESILLIGGEPF